MPLTISPSVHRNTITPSRSSDLIWERLITTGQRLRVLQIVLRGKTNVFCIRKYSTSRFRGLNINWKIKSGAKSQPSFLLCKTHLHLDWLSVPQKMKHVRQIKYAEILWIMVLLLTWGHISSHRGWRPHRLPQHETPRRVQSSLEKALIETLMWKNEELSWSFAVLCWFV